MGKIAEASLVDDRADGSLREQGITEHIMRARQTLVEQEPRERRSVALEQRLHMARGAPMARCEPGERQFVTVQAAQDFHFNRMQARGAHAPTIRSCGSIARWPERKRDEIINIIDDKLMQCGARNVLLF